MELLDGYVKRFCITFHIEKMLQMREMLATHRWCGKWQLNGKEGERLVERGDYGLTAEQAACQSTSVAVVCVCVCVSNRIIFTLRTRSLFKSTISGLICRLINQIKLRVKFYTFFNESFKISLNTFEQSQLVSFTNSCECIKLGAILKPNETMMSCLCLSALHTHIHTLKFDCMSFFLQFSINFCCPFTRYN